MAAGWDVNQSMSSAETIRLRGITWNHVRGYVSVVATAQRFEETHPNVKIMWEKRSLQAFADEPVEQLAEKYDLLVIDHPWAGLVAKSGVLLPLQDHLPAHFLADQAENSVGESHCSYNFDGYQCALAIDAATPVASYRPDKLAQSHLPRTWEELLMLARQQLVIMPGIPLDTLMNFYMVCSTLGHDPFTDDAFMVPEHVGLTALVMLRELASYCPADIYGWNPIAVYEALSSQNEWAYCPFAYGYSNYARKGYGRNLLHFTDVVSIEGRAGRTTLGGTGLAISRKSGFLETAVSYAQFTASTDCQRTLFFESGGQPGHRTAWLDETVNQRTNNFFLNTLPTLDRAYLRPRYPGYLHFQDHAGDAVQHYVKSGGNPKQVLNTLDNLYQQSKELFA